MVIKGLNVHTRYETLQTRNNKCGQTNKIDLIAIIGRTNIIRNKMTLLKHFGTSVESGKYLKINWVTSYDSSLPMWLQGGKPNIGPQIRYQVIRSEISSD